MSGKKKMYSIGQMAEMSNASAKQLRYLEAKGLLMPSRGKDNNYRYYSVSQFNRLAYIKTLRDLGFSFEDVVSILDADNKEFFASALQRQVAQAQAAVSAAFYAYERLAHYSSQYLTASLHTQKLLMQKKHMASGTGITCKVVDIPEQRVIFIREKASATSVELFIDRYFCLQQLCIDSAVLPAGSMYAIFHDGYYRQFDDASEDLETFFPTFEKKIHKEHTRMFGGFKGVSAVHIGHYKYMKEVYVQMEEWSRANGLFLGSGSIEKYLFGPDMTTNPEEFVTEIIIPLSGFTL